MAKIYKRTMPNGREIMIKFGYADNSGEYYSIAYGTFIWRIAVENGELMVWLKIKL